MARRGARRGRGAAAAAAAAAVALAAAAGGARGQAVLLRGGRVVNADLSRDADVLIDGGKIVRVAPGIAAPAGAKVVDCAGKLVMPGGIDPHTHLDMPFMGQITADDYQTGQEAALAGGTTMHIDFALPVDKDLRKGYEVWSEKAKRSVMDYGFHMAVFSWSDKVAADMKWLTEQGVNSFKFFLAYKGALMVEDDEFLKGLQQCKKIGAVAMVHCENGHAVAEGQQTVFDSGCTDGPECHALSRPKVLETEATARAIHMAAFVNTPLYIVHVMAGGAAQEVMRARQNGQRVIGEPIASGLFWTQEKMWDEDWDTAAQYVMSPPIREAEDRQILRRGLAQGHLQLVGTDHAVFNSTQKRLGRNDFRIIPNGVNGLEERLHITWETMVNTGMISENRFVEVTSTECAKIFNIYPRKGYVGEGSDADVIVFDPAVEHTIRAKDHHSAMDTNIYEGVKIKGRVTHTVSRGKIVWENGVLTTERGAGRFVETPAFSPHLFDGLEKNDDYRKGLEMGAPIPRSSAAPLGRSEL